MNASNREKVIADLDTAIKQKQAGWTGYLVIVVPKKLERYKKELTTRRVFEVDGATFYDCATQHKFALHDLYHAVEQILKNKNKNLTGDVLQYCSSILESGIPK